MSDVTSTDAPALIAPRALRRLLAVWPDGRAEEADFPTPAEVLDWTRQDDTRALFPSPDSRRVACLDADALWLHDLVGQRVARIFDLFSEAPPFSAPILARVSWSPCSRRLLARIWLREPFSRQGWSVFAWEDRRVDVWMDLETGERYRLSVDGDVRGWFPDGELLIASGDRALTRLDPRSCQATPIPVPRGLLYAFLRPGTASIVGGRGELLVQLAVDGGGGEVFAEIGQGEAKGFRWSPDGQRLAWLARDHLGRWCVRCLSRGALVTHQIAAETTAAPELLWAGNQVIAASTRGALHTLRGSGGPAALRTRSFEPRHPEPRPVGHLDRRRVEVRQRLGFLTSLYDRAADGQEPEGATDPRRAAWRQLVRLLSGPEPAHHAQAVALLEALDDPRLWRAMALATKRSGSSLLLYDGGRGGSLSDGQIRAALLALRACGGAPPALAALLDVPQDLSSLAVRGALPWPEGP